MLLERYYIYISILIAVVSLIIVYAGLDKRRTNVRRVVIISVMTALSISSRFIFAAIPGFKPMAAIVILTGIYMGGEAGFLCGSLTAFLSNFYFGQGPWTPFQMAAFGLVGLFGALFSKWLKKSYAAIAVYGLIAGVFYSFFMDIWTMLWTYGGFDPSGYKAALFTAIPYTVMYALSNIIFLVLLRSAFGRRLERIITKYRI